MRYMLTRLAPFALLLLLSLAGTAMAARDPLDIITCVWEGPNGECG